jgi:predicted phosphoribosyltransferase
MHALGSFFSSSCTGRLWRGANVSPPFENREHAGKLLAQQLHACRFRPRAVVLALPRGGVPAGFEVARSLGLPLDVLVVRRIAVPWRPGLSMGAVSGDVCVLDEAAIRRFEITAEEMERITAAEVTQSHLFETSWRNEAAALDLRGGTAILVDDGLVTGSTMVAAMRHARRLGAERVVVAVPVGSRDACSLVAREADEFVCLTRPRDFHSVSECYREFPEVRDDDVRAMLLQGRKYLTPQRASFQAA